MTLSIPSDLFSAAPHAMQARAVELAAQHRVLVITGGPGTGKTFTVNAVLKMFEANGLEVVMCAPTGKAANRITEQTGRPASTIHRLLGYKPDGGWEFDASNPLSADVVVVDETSMVDTELFAALISAIRSTARLVVVGDVDQLPSIGSGRVLHDLIASDAVPVVRLTHIFRQASESAIPHVARALNEGVAPDLDTKHPDVMFVDLDDAEDVARAIVSAFKTHLPNRGFNADDIQVLVPQRSRTIGVEALNARLQRELNSEAASGRSGVAIGGESAKAYTGDRVIHTANNYDLEVMNGTIGRVVQADWRGFTAPSDARVSPTSGQRVLVVDFGTEGRVAYTKQEAYDLQLAYAITIHKSQGSQFRAVVMPVHSDHTFMLTRPLVYTGLTRASEFALLLGQRQAIDAAAGNLRGVHRDTTLAARVAGQI